MRKIAPEAEEAQDPDTDFKPLTPEEARRLRERNPSVSPWWVVAGQIVAGLLVALLAWGLTGRGSVGWSAGYGALAVAVPAAVFAWGVVGRGVSSSPNAAIVRFFAWELVKLALAVAMLVAAPRLISALSWSAMLAGFVVAMQAYWVVALTFRARKRKTSE